MTEAVPWVKWHFDRWRNDEGLRVCSLAARGLWADLLAIMHRCEPYGHLVINGRPPTNKQIVAMIGVGTELKVIKLLTELEQNGVFSRVKGGENDGVIFSRKMVRDHAERHKNRTNGQLGGNPNIKPVNGVVNPPAHDGVKAEKEKEKEKEKERIPPVVLPTEPRPVRAKARNQISPDWKPTEAGIAYAKERGVQPGEVRAFKDFHMAKGNLMADWDAAWRMWCRNSVKFGNTTPLLKPRDDRPSPMAGGFG